jgi:Protein of unknown function (DUF2568)
VALRAAVLTIRFVCELGALAAVADWGYHTAGAALGVLCAGVVAAVWGTFLAPKRRIDLPLPGQLAIELAVWAAAAAGLWSAGRPGLAGLLFVAAVVTGGLNAGMQPSLAAPGRPTRR